MSIPFSNTHYRIPQGFGNLLEGLTREILREQPDNIPAFAAAYFENLLEKRESKLFKNRHLKKRERDSKCLTMVRLA